MPSLTDDKMTYLRTATGLNDSLRRMERVWWLSLSSLPESSLLSVTDAMMLKLPGPGSLADRYLVWLNTFAASSGVSGSIKDKEKALYAAGGPTFGTGWVLDGGVGTKYLKINDSPANSLVGDIDIQIRINVANWIPGSTRVLASKQVAGVAWSFNLLFDGTLLLHTSGSSGISTVAVSFTNGVMNWLRVTRVAATGVITFYTAADGASPSWVALGTPVSNTAGAIPDTTDAVGAAGKGDGTSTPLLCTLAEIHIKSTIGGADVENLVYPSLTSISGGVWQLQ